ncbi:MAG: Asp-tRNA(Asn)/Glu-tRNA(Gln) amidotransferase subunit GatC [Candidatus Colwellbacteria bacterium]|nr:Asp-tRNA(Asn)/Glu-tRNA(Gln) amidotransferase subunit GatC [Candidatus Colwellbacteria bacterium]MDD3752891.1 Asp-tRNA(Asn)/Glu-tRNA(Gln) amidotransferase subunit GatC [Candidatus Colwellbacteria bacterium]MDD4818769.1 Asp-tRNA(Asn)/Glu-tRNA(Gln) amidotransferase subunit GatC [Candidatus Colwellbacteria bacterium]
MALAGIINLVMLKDIKKEDIERLAQLARIDIEGKEAGLVKDAENILEYFEQLKDVNTDNISPMSGASDMVNQAEADDIDKGLLQKGIESFPETKDGYLKVPGVMKNND